MRDKYVHFVESIELLIVYNPLFIIIHYTVSGPITHQLTAYPMRSSEIFVDTVVNLTLSFTTLAEKL